MDRENIRHHGISDDAVAENHFEFDAELTLETLKSEALRSTILARIASVAFVIAIGIFTYVQWRDIPILSERRSGLVLTIGLALLAVYEFWFSRQVSAKQASNRKPGEWLWYANAFVEVSFPTCVVLLISDILGDASTALLSPAVMLYFVFIVLSTLRLSFALSLFTGTVAAIEYVSVALLFLSDTETSNVQTILHSRVIHVARGLIIFASGIAAGFVSTQIRRRIGVTFQTIAERDTVLRVFGQHTAPEVVEELLRSGSHTSERRDVAIMFFDIRGFTSFSEHRDPAEVVDLLNAVFESVIRAITRNHGVVHQLLGDGVMAVFGAPVSHGNSCDNAVRAALEIVSDLDEVEVHPTACPFHVGIGLHYGSVVAGTVGSHIHREYKVTGDVVNVASRIEALNKKFGSTILASAAVMEHLDSESVEAHKLGATNIRGRSLPIVLYQLR